VGSLGTLGVIAELTFKVAPLPPVEATLLVPFPDVARASGAVREILRSTLQPHAAEWLDREAGAEVGLGALVPGEGCLLAVLVGGIPPAVGRQIRDLARIARQAGGLSSEELEGAASGRFWAAIADLAGGGGAGGAIRCKASVPPAAGPAAARALAEAGRTLGARPTMWAHAGSGIVYARWPGALAGGDRAPLAAEALAGARRVIRSHLGSLVVEEAPPGLKRHLDVWGYDGDALGAMRAVKSQLDPGGILNPGRFVGGI
jgi:glycolate oxidase FAD binding subunit